MKASAGLIFFQRLWGKPFWSLPAPVPASPRSAHLTSSLPTSSRGLLPPCTSPVCHVPSWKDPQPWGLGPPYQEQNLISRSPTNDARKRPMSKSGHSLRFWVNVNPQGTRFNLLQKG